MYSFCRPTPFNLCLFHTCKRVFSSKDVSSTVSANAKGSKPVRTKTPIGKLDEFEAGKHPYQEKDPLPPFPDGVNPNTGEVGGPKGPEPTRYGDWERKGRVTDF